MRSVRVCKFAIQYQTWGKAQSTGLKKDTSPRTDPRIFGDVLWRSISPTVQDYQVRITGTALLFRYRLMEKDLLTYGHVDR